MFNRVHKVYRPHPFLKSLINNIVIQKVNLDSSLPLPLFPMPPIQEQAIFFYPLDVVHLEIPTSHERIELPRSSIVARRFSRHNVMMGYNHMVIKVGFQPGGLYRLFGIPMSEYGADEDVNETALCIDKGIPLIIEQLQEALSFEHMIGIIQKWLLGKLHLVRNELPIDRVLPVILNKGNIGNITELASHACVSTRQLELLFQQRIGLTPQYYARLVRFTKAWTLKESAPDFAWTALAHTCGYFDQMHMLRDFKEFTGVTPTVAEKELRNLPCMLQSEVFY